jgi:hypothetical protein
VGRILHQLGFSHISARPRHPGQKAETIAAFKKRARVVGPPVAVETGRAMVVRRGAAEKFLVDLTP